MLVSLFGQQCQILGLCSLKGLSSDSIAAIQSASSEIWLPAGVTGYQSPSDISSPRISVSPRNNTVGIPCPSLHDQLLVFSRHLLTLALRLLEEDQNIRCMPWKCWQGCKSDILPGNYWTSKHVPFSHA